MEQIRILHMIGSFEVGGSQAMVINLYRAIDRSKIQFDFVVDHPDRMALAQTVRDMGARIYIMPTFVGSNIVHVREAWDIFLREHPEYKVLHSHVRSYASVFLPIAKKHGLKTIIHSHSTSNGKGLKAMVKAAMQYPLRFMADYYFSCSEEAGRWLFGKKIVTGNRHHIIKNAIDAGAYRYDEAVRQKYICDLGLDGKLVYAHVGRFHPAKNHSFLLRVFKQIYANQSSAVLMLLGDGDLRADIEKQINELGIREAVILLGNRHDIPQVLQAADIFLFPSLWEGLGIVAVEAQAAGLGCICSDQVPQLVKVTENCHFLPLEEALWVNAALNATKNRADTYEEIVSAGYDVLATAEWLQKFYMRIWKET